MITSQDTTRQYDGPFAEGQTLYFDISLVEIGDLIVTADSDRLQLNSDYSVSAVKSEGLIIGASITLLKEIPATLITVDRVTPATQEQDYPENGPMEALDIERALDKLTMLAQESRTVLGRYIQINDGEKSAFINTLPKADAKRRVLVMTNERISLSPFDAQELYDVAEQVKHLDPATIQQLEQDVETLKREIVELRNTIQETYLTIEAFEDRVNHLSFKSLPKSEYDVTEHEADTIYFATEG